jgi:hypothetical protein
MLLVAARMRIVVLRKDAPRRAAEPVIALRIVLWRRIPMSHAVVSPRQNSSVRPVLDSTLKDTNKLIVAFLKEDKQINLLYKTLR